MAEQNRSTLKEYFKAGAKPTEEEYKDLIDSFVSRTEDDYVETLPPLPNATTTKKGIAEQATLSEVQTGTDDTRFVTPKGAKRAVETFASSLAPVQSVNGQTGDVVINIIEEDSGWQTPILLNGIQNYDSSYQGVRYRKKNGVVYIEGAVKGGGAGLLTVIFTLPVGFRPSKRLIFNGGKSGSTPVRIDIATDGNIHCYGYDTTLTSISGISFLVD
ncbi:hypothetical protein [Tenacibaculum amylolyticum]|uniref:hypothetical protein n=1 Tax=Tenacibaculum amylolyticum TaxID=104269 RepID=UPI003893E2CE